LPDRSDGSTAIPPIAPEKPLFCVDWVIEAGPTDVQVVPDWRLVGSMLKIRKLTSDWSATGSPRPLPGVPFWKVIDQLLSTPADPVPLAGLSLTISFQVPWAWTPFST